MEYRQLGKTDMKVSHLSYGSSALGSVFRATNTEESVAVVNYAINEGINYIDTAPWYGQRKAEDVLGKALQTIPRDKFYLSTKVGRYETDPRKMIDFSAERTFRSVDESLQRLGVDYVDVIQVHDMEFATKLSTIWNETLPALQKIKDSGKARYIGITGYPLENFRTVLEHSTVKIDTILTYCHYSMNDTTLDSYMSYFNEKGVGVINASPISMGLLSNRGPPDWHPAPANIRGACRDAAAFCKENNVDISRAALDFTLRNNEIPTTLVSTASLTNLKENIRVAKEGISARERDIQQTCVDRYFRSLGQPSWEGIEVEQHRRDIEEGATMCTYK